MQNHLWLFASALIMPIVAYEGSSQKLIFPSLPIAVSNTNNSRCRAESELYIQNLENSTLWAHEMWDATAKSSTGILQGNIFQMGHFEECLAADAPFLTKYCLTQIEARNIPEPKEHCDSISLHHHPNEHILERLYPYKDVSQQTRNHIQVGWCIPASCTAQDLEKFLNYHFTHTDLPFADYNVSYLAKISQLSCSTRKDNDHLTPADVCFCSLSLILVCLVVITTFCDFHTVEEKGKELNKKSLFSRFGMAFSARKNFNELTKADESNSALKILYGIRTLAIFCIILDHRFGTFTSSALLNFDYVETQYRAPLAPFLFHGDLFVDSFFVLGGLLVTYGLLNQFDKKKINPGFIILMRYIRLTPVYAFVIFYYATIFNYTGSGPLWRIIAGQDSQDCKDNWWTNLLYISNYVNADHMCMTHSWYLPCDFHYFIIAIGICLLIKKQKKLGLFVLLLFTILSMVIPFVITIVYQRPALLHFYPEFLTAPKVHPDFLLTYSKSHTRATPYFVGMFSGYIYYKLQGNESHISRIRSHVYWIISIFFILACILGGSIFYDPYHKYNALESATYAALNRLAFALGSVGILHVTSFGHATFIHAILTWTPWIPLSKLVYGAYLVHMQFQLRAAAVFMNPRKFNYFDVISLSLSDMVLAFVTSLLLYLLVEAPFRKVFKEILMPNKVSPPQESTDSATVRENIRNGSCDSRL